MCCRVQSASFFHLGLGTKKPLTDRLFLHTSDSRLVITGSYFALDEPTRRCHEPAEPKQHQVDGKCRF
jgi:hypothetical protein